MVPIVTNNVILVVVDSNFVNLCKDPEEYVTRLRKVLSERQKEIVIMTVTGRYGISSIDSSISAIPVDDKNKTVFGNTLENLAGMFDELITVSNTVSDPYILIAKEVSGNAQKTVTNFGYQRRL